MGKTHRFRLMVRVGKKTQWWRKVSGSWSIMGASGFRRDTAQQRCHRVSRTKLPAVRSPRDVQSFLTIPIVPEAHGLTARTYSRTIAPLFAVKGVLAQADEKLSHRYQAGIRAEEINHSEAMEERASTGAILHKRIREWSASKYHCAGRRHYLIKSNYKPESGGNLLFEMANENHQCIIPDRSGSFG